MCCSADSRPRRSLMSRSEPVVRTPTSGQLTGRRRPVYSKICRSPVTTGGVVAVSEGASAFSAAIRQHWSALGTVFSGRVPMDDDDG